MQKHLPRLPPEFYLGRAWVHWSMTIQDRAKGWLDARFHASFRNAFARSGSERKIGCLAYCLMPDHIHALLCGMAETSDQRLFVQALRRELNAVLNPFQWQKQPYDNVVRERERTKGALLTMAHYIVENPVRAGLVKDRNAWPYKGSWLPGPGWLDPCATDFGTRFWSGYNQGIAGG